METRASIYRSWDDLVFAARNKAYGAYVLRKAYARRLVLAVGMSTTMIALMLVVPEVISRFTGGPISHAGERELPVIHIFDVPPIIPREVQPPKNVQPPVKTARTNTTILVVNHPVEPPVQDQSTATVPTEGEPGEGQGTPNGVGAAITDIPVIVEPDKNKVWDFVETPPVYEGGMEAIMKFVKKKLRYPAGPRRQGIDGTVYISFVVNGDGSVSEVKVLRGIHVECDEEAARVISMLPSWTGGKQNGNPVRVRMVLPIRFSLQ